MQKYFGILSVFVGMFMFVFGVLVVEEGVKFPYGAGAEFFNTFAQKPAQFHAQVIPIDIPVNVESRYEVPVVNLPEMKIAASPAPGTTKRVTGAGAARRRAVTVESQRAKGAGDERLSVALPGEIRFSTEAARQYRPVFREREVREAGFTMTSEVGRANRLIQDQQEPLIFEVN